MENITISLDFAGLPAQTLTAEVRWNDLMYARKGSKGMLEALQQQLIEKIESMVSMDAFSQAYGSLQKDMYRYRELHQRGEWMFRANGRTSWRTNRFNQEEFDEIMREMAEIREKHNISYDAAGPERDLQGWIERTADED